MRKFLFYLCATMLALVGFFSAAFAATYNQSETIHYHEVESFSEIGYKNGFESDITITEQGESDGCVYFKMELENSKAYIDFWVIHIPDQEATCQYLGVLVECELGDETFDFAGYENELEFAIEFSALEGFKPSFLFSWGYDLPLEYLDYALPCFSAFVPDSGEVKFPIGGFTSFVVDNALSASSQAVGCTPP